MATHCGHGGGTLSDMTLTARLTVLILAATDILLYVYLASGKDITASLIAFLATSLASVLWNGQSRLGNGAPPEAGRALTMCQVCEPSARPMRQHAGSESGGPQLAALPASPFHRPWSAAWPLCGA
jgi:hypothetical protein